MVKQNKVSVILTSYNHAKFLREAIDSVLNQTYADFEFIIWDDASTDESWQIITSYSDPRIRAFRNDINMGGAGGNIRKAIAEAETGEYIAIHHSDDIWEAQKLEKQVAFLDAHPGIGAVFTWVQIIDENGEPFKDTLHFYYKVFDQPNRSRHEWLNYFFFKGNALCHPSVLIRKKCYDECGSYRVGMAQIADFDLWVRLCMKYEIHVLPEKLVRFRVRSDELNASGNRPEPRIRGHFELLQLLYNYRNILTFTELVKVFPAAHKYLKPGGFDVGYALGMMAIEVKLSDAYELFGLLILFEAINDPDRAKKIKEIYDFTYSDFIALTGHYDIFSVVQKENLYQQLREREQSVQALTAQAAKKEQAVQTFITGKEQQVQALTAYVTEKEQAVQTFVAEKEQQVQTLTAQLAEKEQSVQALTAQVAEKEQQVQVLTAQVPEKEQVVQALTTQVAEKEQQVQALSAQLAEKK